MATVFGQKASGPNLSAEMVFIRNQTARQPDRGNLKKQTPVLKKVLLILLFTFILFTAKVFVNSYFVL